MAWAPYQYKRIKIEDYYVRKYFPSFKIHYGTYKIFWNGAMITNSNNYYGIKIVLPANYPEDVPAVYITYPCPLLMYNGSKLTDMNTSHQMHVFKSDNEYVKICIFRSENWSSDDTVFKCLKKTRIWLEAYDKHLRTGIHMCNLLGTQT